MNTFVFVKSKQHQRNCKRNQNKNKNKKQTDNQKSNKQNDILYNLQNSINQNYHFCQQSIG
jgi:hypothetical protein